MMTWPPQPGMLVVDRWGTTYLVRRVLAEPDAPSHTAALWAVGAKHEIELGRGAWTHRGFVALAAANDDGDRCADIPLGNRRTGS